MRIKGGPNSSSRQTKSGVFVTANGSGDDATASYCTLKVASLWRQQKILERFESRIIRLKKEGITFMEPSFSTSKNPVYSVENIHIDTCIHHLNSKAFLFVVEELVICSATPLLTFIYITGGI